MQTVKVTLPCGKQVLFECTERGLGCTSGRLIQRYQQTGLTHFDGHRYFPKDGEKFLEAMYDYCVLSGLHVEGT